MTVIAVILLGVLVHSHLQGKGLGGCHLCEEGGEGWDHEKVYDSDVRERLVSPQGARRGRDEVVTKPG